MVGGALIEGSGRRLPQWMLGRSAVDEVEKSRKTTEAQTKQTEEGLSSQSATKRLFVGKEKGLLSSDVLVKCRTRKRKNLGAWRRCNSTVDRVDSSSSFSWFSATHYIWKRKCKIVRPVRKNFQFRFIPWFTCFVQTVILNSIFSKIPKYVIYLSNWQEYITFLNDLVVRPHQHMRRMHYLPPRVDRS